MIAGAREETRHVASPTVADPNERAAGANRGEDAGERLACPGRAMSKVMDLHQRAGCQSGDGTSTFERDPNGSNLLLNFRGVSLAGDAASLWSRNHAILRHWARPFWLPKVSSGSVRQACSWRRPIKDTPAYHVMIFHLMTWQTLIKSDVIPITYSR